MKYKFVIQIQNKKHNFIFKNVYHGSLFQTHPYK